MGEEYVENLLTVMCFYSLPHIQIKPIGFETPMDWSIFRLEVLVLLSRVGDRGQLMPKKLLPPAVICANKECCEYDDEGKNQAHWTQVQGAPCCQLWMPLLTVAMYQVTQRRCWWTLGRFEMTIYQETMGSCGNPNINSFYKVTSGSYHNAIRKFPDGSKMLARYYTT